MKFLTLLLAAVALVRSAPISHDEFTAKTSEGLRLLSLSDDSTPVWKTEDERLELMRADVKFFDVTEVYEEQQKDSYKKKPSAKRVTFPAPSKQAAVTPILATLSTSRLSSYSATLSAFNNRYYTSTTGRQASQWILDTITSLAAGRSDITVSAFTHSYTQFSIIAKIGGSAATTPITIIGSHMDSINLSSPSSGRAPGVDDDGSGTVNLIEIFRALVAANFRPSTPVEFHWYAAEEVGLLGSQAIATNYKNAGKAVKAFMELDMTAYFRPGSTEVIALEADYIDSGLNTFVRQLISSYSRLPAANDSPCGYACSDHASWYRAGFPTTMPFEAITGNDNPTIHSSSDTASVSGFSWSHSLEFTKIGLAFVYELAI